MPVIGYVNNDLYKHTGHNKQVSLGIYQKSDSDMVNRIDRFNDKWLISPESSSEKAEAKSVVKLANGFLVKILMWIGIIVSMIIAKAIIILTIHCIIKSRRKNRSENEQEVIEMMNNRENIGIRNNMDTFTRSFLNKFRRN